ncbi:hypothetical protein L2755_21945 [Shewanella abyssi]|uniref:hypothetical protein n=1 Tax=Shewanella abyssi TaxID=311789 RepID=UPI00200DAC9E|nr:hypothetical protein [Shewanella abyssi]MCL1052246.1 hypothetical protein [Shewanella abyssi]
MNLSHEELAKIVNQQPRLYEFVTCLYHGNDYRLNKMKSMDNNNFNIAMNIVQFYYPSEYFYQLVLAGKEPK